MTIRIDSTIPDVANIVGVFLKLDGRSASVSVCHRIPQGPKA